MAQHVLAAGIAPFGTSGAEDLAEIAESGGGKQGIAQRMSGYVTVGMPGAAVSVSEQQAQQPTRPTGLDRVYVGAEPDSGQARHGLQEAAASASSRMVAAFSSSVFSASASSPTRI